MRSTRAEETVQDGASPATLFLVDSLTLIGSIRQPKDSLHPDRDILHSVVVEKWLTNAEYEQAFQDHKLAWQGVADSVPATDVGSPTSTEMEVEKEEVVADVRRCNFVTEANIDEILHRRRESKESITHPERTLLSELTALSIRSDNPPPLRCLVRRRHFSRTVDSDYPPPSPNPARAAPESDRQWRMKRKREPRG